MAVVFAQLGQEVHITGGLLEDAVNEGWPGAMRWAASAARWWETPCGGEHRGQHPRSPPSAAGGGDKLRLTVAPRASAART